MTDLTTTPEEEITPLSEPYFAPERATPTILERPLSAVLQLDWEKTIYLIFILVAIVTRFWDLGNRVMSHDESLHTQFSYQYYNGEGYQHSPLMHGPSLFHATALSYWLLGDSDFSARVPVAILGILLILLPYFLRQWLTPAGSLITSFLFLISPYITYYSRYIRHDIYNIVFSMMIVIAIWHYPMERKERYLWLFAAGMGLMFATMENSFIYVAIFGSFLVVRLLPQILTAPWFENVLPRLRTPILVLGTAVLLIGGGFVAQRASNIASTDDGTTAATQFAVNPTEAATTPTSSQADSGSVARWAQVIGIGVFSVALVMAAREMRPHLDNHPEFDLIMLFTTLTLPSASPFLLSILGWNARDYSLNTCVLQGQETMSAVQVFFSRLLAAECRTAFFNSGLAHSGFFLIICLLISVYVGLWWDSRRWPVAAIIYHVIFALLFTSFFTNPSGWLSGMVGSLGYWLEQHGVQRGNQPSHYYFFVTTLYEYLPLLFALLGVRLWLAKYRVNKLVGYWLTLFLSSWLVVSLVKWWWGRSYRLLGQEIPVSESLGLSQDLVMGLLVGLVLFGLGIFYWFMFRRQQLLDEYDLRRSFQGLIPISALCDITPFLAWWMVGTWAAYSIAGEKMPWLSTHFVIPMALLSGWYFGERLRTLNWRWLLSRDGLVLWLLSMGGLIALFLAVSPIWLGEIRLGNQQAENLAGIGRFLGSLGVAAALFYLWAQVAPRLETAVRRFIVTFSLFALLSLLTMRFAYLASFPNADYTTEFSVYAHGAPATKEVILKQLEELSMRLYGDKSIRVAFDNDVSWPFTWYLRDYPNRYYFHDTPNNSLNESPYIIVGSLNWGKVEPYLGNNYESRTYTFLWWPMEEYRKFSWDAIWGNSLDDPRRGLWNPDVRQALWNIFFYRDYTQYGQTFGGTYTAGQWPLRHELRVYIRKDVLANLWDYGIGATAFQDPYAEREINIAAQLVLNESGVTGNAPGQLSSPRNVAVAADGRIYVADSGNHRIAVYDANGVLVNTWGEFGDLPGQFNEPWGIAVDDQYLYVADTWNYRIQKFTLDGELVGAYGQSGSPIDDTNPNLGFFYGPRDIVLLENNRLAVTDTGNHRVQLMTRDGEFLSQTGRLGNLPGQFNEPVGLASGPGGTVYVADTWNGRIQQFTPDMFALFEWEVSAWSSQSIVNKPYLATDSAGRIYATDPEGYRVLIFDQNGTYIGRFGSFGAELTQFGLPVGITLDAQDNIYVVDSANNRVMKFPALFGAPIPVEEELDAGEIISDTVEEIIEPTSSPTP